MTTANDNAESLWPVLEFRYLETLAGRHPVFRYNDGLWTRDDGAYDLAFIWKRHAIAITLPARRNILWSWVDAHWETREPRHTDCNPRHYALREGASGWGPGWERWRHPNERAAMEAEALAKKIWGEAYRVSIDFQPAAPDIRLGLVRDRESKEVVTLPESAVCFMCGDRFDPRKQYGIGSPFRQQIPG